MNRPELLDYSQKMSLKRLINKHSKYQYSRDSFDKFTKLVDLYNDNLKEGNTKISVSLENPQTYILGNQNGFLLNEMNKKIHRENE